MKQYDYLIVGSGLFGSTFACMAKRQGKKCLVMISVHSWVAIFIVKI